MPSTVLYSPSIFIGREQEIKDFWTALDDPEYRILHIQAAGGMGKTKLLMEFINQLKQMPRDITVIYPDELIDLYHTAYQIELGILNAIANQFPKSFETFKEKLSLYRQDSSISAIQEELRESFVECYSHLKAKYIVLFFDTVEEINDPIKTFFNAVFPLLLKAQPTTLIVTAGRKEFPITKKIDYGVRTIELKGFQQPDIIRYFQHKEISSLIDTQFYENVESLKKLSELSQGKPILIGLTVDWMRNGNFPEDLLNKSVGDFEKELVQMIGTLSELEYRIILAISCFYRRFDEKIITTLFRKTIPSVVEATQHIENIQRYSFIKYRKLNGLRLGGEHSCLLHDEMRVLVQKHVWPLLDDSGIFFKDWTADILSYYSDLILAIKNRFEQTPLEDELLLELHTAQSEKLHYYCSFEFNKAFEYYLSVREDVPSGSLVNVFRQAYLDILKEHKEKMNDEQLSTYHLHQGDLYYIRGHYKAYRKVADSILNMPESMAVIEEAKAKTIARSIQAFTNAGNIKFAIEFGEQYSSFFNKNRLKNDEIKRQYGHFLTAMGYVFRRKGDKDKPKQYYEDAQRIYLQIAYQDKVKFYLASLEINLSFTLHLLGKDHHAIAHCKRALNRSPDYNIQWRGYNVLGIIEADSQRVFEAMQYFESALKNAFSASNKRGTVLIRIAQGRMYRQQGWYKVFHRESFEAAKADYEKAGEYLYEAIKLMEKKPDTVNSPDLADAYMENALLFREQSQYHEALEFYGKSKTLAELYDNDYLITDNLQGMAVTYFHLGDITQAKSIAHEAIAKAYPINGLHIIARAERVLADIAYRDKSYDAAFGYAVSSIVNLLEVDPNSQDDSQPKKERLYNEFCKWLAELLEGLPSPDRSKYVKLMCDKWNESKLLASEKEKWAFDLLFNI